MNSITVQLLNLYFIICKNIVCNRCSSRNKLDEIKRNRGTHTRTTVTARIQLPGNCRWLKMFLSPRTVVERIFTNVSLKQISITILLRHNSLSWQQT